MAWVLTFRTQRFDIGAEQPNPINPIAGQAVLAWLRPAIQEADYRCSEPAPEDWGWYVGVEGSAGSYLVGASGEPGEPGVDVEWVVQVHRTRSLGDKLRGRNRLATDDPLCAVIERQARSDPSLDVLAVGLDD